MKKKAVANRQQTAWVVTKQNKISFYLFGILCTFVVHVKF